MSTTRKSEISFSNVNLEQLHSEVVKTKDIQKIQSFV